MLAEIEQRVILFAVAVTAKQTQRRTDFALQLHHFFMAQTAQREHPTAMSPGYLTGDKIRLYCFGRDGSELAALRPEIATETETMEQAMRAIAPQLKAGDMVLLSPACASLDQFKSFEQRGDVFAQLAKELG